MTRANDIARGYDFSTGIDAGEVLPHIIPDTLYPAVAGKLLDGSTSHSGAYGTAQADGFSYYYTDIKGSKPIKDPRIGAHFGSQRHMMSSAQLLEQETATHGQNTYSIDGRDWLRTTNTRTPSNLNINNQYGNAFQLNNFNVDGEFYEVVGYFNDINILGINWASVASYGLRFAMNGATYTTPSNTFNTTATSPLPGDWANGNGRFLNMGSVLNLPITASLGINTIKITTGSIISGIELIAQDTSSDANKSKIQIPAQNVVSYGKKFSIPATAQHYDPFNGFTNGSSVTAYVDTATSLGVEAWKNSSTYYRPYNGGRVVKWIASDGTIKTSVNMMPPNARSIGNSSSLTNATAKANASIANNTFYPTMEAGAIDHSQAEVAKTFHIREFGNGSANGGTGAPYADTTMLTTTDDTISYVMDDGLTSFSSVLCDRADSIGVNILNGNHFFTFVGTGFSYDTGRTISHGGADDYQYFIDGVSILDQDGTGSYTAGNNNMCQNLPYGTHVFKIETNGAPDTDAHTIREVTFHQPKMPPIPQDAVVIADYMLMADFVPVGANGIDKISKGSRYVSSSRDFFHDTGNGTIVLSNPGGSIVENRGGLTVSYREMNVNEEGPELVWFGDAKIVNDLYAVSDSTEGSKQYFDGATTNVTASSQYTDSGAATTGLPSTSALAYYVYGTKSTGTMGMQKAKFVANPDDTGNDWLYSSGACVASPIHSSSHYKSFSTPFLHELVGGDRNMEQNNLIVTPDGKSWDSVTRNTSYIGDMCIQTKMSADVASGNNPLLFDEWRGNVYYGSPSMNKDFAIAYDRYICLVDGSYHISFVGMAAAGGGQAWVQLKINGTMVVNIEANDEADYRSQLCFSQTFQMKRGDYFSLNGSYVEGTAQYDTNLNVTKV